MGDDEDFVVVVVDCNTGSIMPSSPYVVVGLLLLLLSTNVIIVDADNDDDTKLLKKVERVNSDVMIIATNRALHFKIVGGVAKIKKKNSIDEDTQGASQMANIRLTLRAKHH